MWSEFACPANQHPQSTIKKKSPQTFAHLVHFSKNVWFMQSCYFDYRINKPFAYFSQCSLHLISTCYARKRSQVFYFNYPQINVVGKSGITESCVVQSSILRCVSPGGSGGGWYRFHCPECNAQEDGHAGGICGWGRGHLPKMHYAAIVQTTQGG